MIFLERIKTVLSVAVMLTDVLSPDQRAMGDLFLKVPGVMNAPMKHSTGYFLLINLPEGKYSMTAGGVFYWEEEFTVDTSELDQKLPLFDSPSLKPNDNHPFPVVTLLRGNVVDEEDNPVSGASITVKDLFKKAISDDNGAFFIWFGVLEEDITIDLLIQKDGFKDKKVKNLFLPKNITTTIDPAIKLTP